MKSKTVEISQLLVSPIQGRPTTVKLSQVQFDYRSDLVATPRTLAMAVLAEIFNPGWLDADNDRRISRRVILILTDGESGACVAVRQVPVRISGCVVCSQVSTMLPFKAADLPLDRDYILTAVDMGSGRRLCERRFHVFPECFRGRRLSGVYTAVIGGFSPMYRNQLFQSHEVPNGDYPRVHFELSYSFNEILAKLPEAEIRLYFPDGKLSRTFNRVILDNPDTGRCHVEVPFLMAPGRRGLVYAEVSVDDTPFAGFVFRTEGKDIGECVCGGDLRILPEYSLELAAERFRSQKRSEQEGEYIDFDALLDRFIADETARLSDEDDTE